MPDAPASAPAAAPAAASAPVPAAAQAGAPAPEAGKAGEGNAAAEVEPKFKVKVNGAEKEVSLSELQKHYGTFESSQAALKKAAEQTKIADEALSYIKQGTKDSLRAAGMSDEQIRQVGIELLSEEYQALQEQDRQKSLSPEQRELEAARKALKDAQDDKDRLAKEQKAAQVGHYKQAISAKVIETLEQFPESVRRNEMLANNVFHAWAYVLEHPEEAQKLGIEVSPAGIKAALVKRQRALARELMVHDKDEELEEYLAPTVKGRLFKTHKAAAEAGAHPSLTSEARSRNGQAPAAVPRVGRSKVLRNLTKPFST